MKEFSYGKHKLKVILPLLSFTMLADHIACYCAIERTIDTLAIYYKGYMILKCYKVTKSNYKIKTAILINILSNKKESFLDHITYVLDQLELGNKEYLANLKIDPRNPNLAMYSSEKLNVRLIKINNEWLINTEDTYF